MLQFPVTTLGSFALELLNSASAGHVHSVYHKTINIQVGSYLLALQAAYSPLSPVSLITGLDASSMMALPVLPDQMAEISSGRLTVHCADRVIYFCFSDAAVYDSALSGKSPCLSQGLLKSILDHSYAGGFRCLFTSSSIDDPVTAAARQHLTSCRNFMQMTDYEKAADELSCLIGLGVGLTPSGDDFLCGVLAGLILSGNTQHPFFPVLKERIRTSLTNTNDISRTFLRCALSSHFSKPIKDLASPASPGIILASFEAVGHSSGIDSLCGIYFALTLI